MSFEKKDKLALERGRLLGFCHRSIDTADTGWSEPVYRFEFGCEISPELTARDITAALEALVRFNGTEAVTLWIDITTDIIPETLIRALEGCWFFAPNIYVSHKEKASHRPAPPLPVRVQTAIEKIASTRHFWHPILRMETDAHPSR